MADTRPRARAAGSARGLLALALLALAGCQSAPRPAAPLGFVVPAGSYAGGHLSPPGAATPALGPFRGFLSPAAVAVHGADLFVADAGLDAVFHLDTTTLVLRRMEGLRAHAGLRLRAAGDGTLYVLDPLRRELLRVARDGRPLERVQDTTLLSGAADFAVDRTDGRILVADRGQNRILAFSRTLGASVQLLLPRGRDFDAPWALASGSGRALYVADRARGQVVALDRDGRLLQAFGAGLLRLPGRLGVDRYGRVYVQDAADNALHVFLNGQRIATLAAGELGGAIFDFAIEDSELVVAAPGAVRVFRLLPPGETR